MCDTLVLASGLRIANPQERKKSRAAAVVLLILAGGSRHEHQNRKRGSNWPTFVSELLPKKTNQLQAHSCNRLHKRSVEHMPQTARQPAQSEGIPRRATQGFFQVPNSVAENLSLLTPAEKDLTLIIFRRGQGTVISEATWKKWTGKERRIMFSAVKGLRDKGLTVNGIGDKATYSFDKFAWDKWVQAHPLHEKARTAGRKESVTARPGMQVHPECRERGCQQLCESKPAACDVVSIDSFVQPVAQNADPPGKAGPPPSQIEKPKSTASSSPKADREPSNPMAESDANFQRVMGAFLSLGVAINESDVNRCLKLWAGLREPERTTAAAYAIARANDEWAERAARYIPRPWNYLGEKHWERNAPVRAREVSMSKGERAQRAAAEDFLKDLKK